MPQHDLTPGLEVVKAEHVDRLRERCRLAIMSGYRSDALGEVHVYPSTLEDQANMGDSVLSSMMADVDDDWTTPFTCVKPADQDSEDWPWIEHTAAQIQKAGMDGKRFITAQRQTLRRLVASVRAAETEADALAIRWPE